MLWARRLVIVTVACEGDSWWYSRRTWMGGALLAAGFLIPWAANRLDPLIGATLRELGYYRAWGIVSLAALLGFVMLALPKGKQSSPRAIQICVIALLVLYAYTFVEFSTVAGI